jgi:hypothetical protein
MEEANKSEARKFYTVACRMKAGFQPRTSICQERDNNLIGNDRLIMRRWMQYFYGTLNIKDMVEIREELIYQVPEQQIEPPTKYEVWEIIRTLKHHVTRTGQYQCRTEVWNKTLWEEIHALIEVLWASEKKPENWQTATVCPIHKKGDKLQCSNLGDYESVFRKR